MHAEICEIADDYRGKWQDLEALMTAENQRKQQLEADIEQLNIDFNEQEIRMHAIRQERDALAMQNQQMREALTLCYANEIAAELDGKS